MSRDANSDAPATAHGIRGKLDGTATQYGIEQKLSQPRCFRPVDAECFSKYSGLVPAARVRRIETVTLQLAEIEDGAVGIWQNGHADNSTDIPHVELAVPPIARYARVSTLVGPIKTGASPEQRPYSGMISGLLLGNRATTA